MPRITVITREGATREIVGRKGWSVMEVIREAGIDELLALCGGCLSCATCHVHVDVEWVVRLKPMGRDEDDLLDTSDHRAAGSRLSCQILLTDELDGLRVTVAPED